MKIAEENDLLPIVQIIDLIKQNTGKLKYTFHWILLSDLPPH